MTDILQREAIYFWYYFSVQLRQIFGYWVLGMLIGSFISVFMKDYIHDLFRSIRSKRLGAFGIVIASALGIASPLCMYGTIPIAASFSKSGMSDDWLAAFMMSSILLNPQLIIYSAALGIIALLVRIVACFLCGITVGVLIRIFYTGRPFFNFDGFEKPRKERESDRPLFSDWNCAFRSLSKVCAGGGNDGAVWRERGVWRLYGSYDRSTALYVRRRYDTAFADVAL